MVRRGYIHHGMIQPIGPLDLPEGSLVVFQPLPGPAGLDGDEHGFSSHAFWDESGLEELARRQGTNPCRSLEDLRGDWPMSESLDDFQEAVRRGRE